jgi:hypothetical protein
MRSVLYFIFAGLLLQAVSTGINAQETAVYEGLTYYLNKAEAFEAATAQNKQVFMFWGTTGCSRCNAVKANLAHETLRTILDENYILWFCDAKQYLRNSPEVIDYLPQTEEPLGYPALCVIDTFDITKAYGFINGVFFSVHQLSDLLSRYVANDYVGNYKSSTGAYVSQQKLVVKSNVAREEITVYAVTGAQIDKFVKRDPTSTRDAASYPPGILIISGSSGWAKKIIMK